MSRLDEELFKDLNRTNRPMKAREETLNKLQKRVGQNRRHILPIFLSGILTAAAIVLLTFLLFDSNLQQSTKQGEVTDGMEQRIFEGSSGDWSAEYEVTEKTIEGESQESIRYILSFRGFDFPEKVDYEIRLPDGSVESGNDVPFGIGSNIKGTGTCDCSLMSGEEPIKVSISGNGTTETFDLREKLLKPLPASGAGASWSFTYEPGAFGEKDVFIIDYIGEGQAPKEIDYEVDAIMGGSSGTGHQLDEGKLVKKGDMQNLEIYQENQVLEINVHWEGQSESFTASPK